MRRNLPAQALATAGTTTVSAVFPVKVVLVLVGLLACSRADLQVIAGGPDGGAGSGASTGGGAGGSSGGSGGRGGLGARGGTSGSGGKGGASGSGGKGGNAGKGGSGGA